MFHTVCHRGFLNISADEKSRQLKAEVYVTLTFDSMPLVCAFRKDVSCPFWYTYSFTGNFIFSE